MHLTPARSLQLTACPMCCLLSSPAPNLALPWVFQLCQLPALSLVPGYPCSCSWGASPLNPVVRAETSPERCSQIQRLGWQGQQGRALGPSAVVGGPGWQAPSGCHS